MSVRSNNLEGSELFGAPERRRFLSNHYRTMTRDVYDKATVALDRFNKLTHIRDKIKREFPEFEYDPQLKALAKDIFEVIEAKIKAEADQFGKL